MKLMFFIMFLVAAAATKKPACPKCGENEYPVKCKTLCPPQSCEIAYTTYLCDPELKCEPGCDCIPNYLRNKDNKCILNDDCPPPPFNA